MYQNRSKASLYGLSLAILVLGLTIPICINGAASVPALSVGTTLPTDTLVMTSTLYLPFVAQWHAGKTVVLFSTPKFIQDFDNPEPSISAFFDHYAPFTQEPYGELILIFAVGNSEHILKYQGRDRWHALVEWARYINNDRPFTDPEEIFSEATLNYAQIHDIVLKFKAEAARRHIPFKIYDQIDQAYEFCYTDFKSHYHRECMLPDDPWKQYAGYEIMAELNADTCSYATAPQGIPQGKNAGDFLVEQTSAYIHDLEFDGVLYGNQLGTRGHWWPDGGPGFSETESAAILHFFRYSKEQLGDKDFMWFDSYNNVQIEHDRYSVPAEAYRYFDYIMVSGFCTITNPDRYLDNLNSKIGLRSVTKILATLDYVDPWYDYNAKDAFPEESRELAKIAIAKFDQIDGLVMFGNDELGNFIPQGIIVDFTSRFGDRQSD